MISRTSVIVVDYDSSWPQQFQREAEKLRALLGDNCIDVHHIGSTAIPGLAAKPILDMIPVVKDITLLDRDALEAAGYTWMGEFGMLFRRFCTRYQAGKIPIHAHIWEAGNSEIDKHLLFRDYLICHPDELVTYAQLKFNLAGAHSEDRFAYTIAKDDWIKSIISKSGFNGRLLVEAKTPAEWQAYKRLYKVHPNIDDSDPTQRHIVMSLGTKIIGFAHVDLSADSAIIKAEEIDQDYQDQGHEEWLHNQITRWLSIHQTPAKST